jgi:hypothetical protein
MNRNHNAIALIGVLAFLTLLMVGWSTAASADTNPSQTIPAQNNGTLWDIRNHWKLRNMLGACFLPTEAGGCDSIQNGQSTGPGTVTHGPGPVQMWPVQIPTATSQVPSQRDTGISKNLMTTFGYPLSDTQFQILGRMNDNIKLEEDSDPERAMWNSTAQGAMQSGSAANSAAGMTANQGQSAITFQEKFLVNFTSEAGNRWLVIRDQLFIPIAVLLLLPGAVLCQVKAIVAQGSNVLGEVNPFEGIFRSIIAIFMIPGTLLVINYGIDVSNSVHYTIADEYSRIFGTNMYYDAQCAMARAFPVNTQNSNLNALKPSNPTTAPVQGNAIQSTYEALDLDVRQYDPCAGLDNSVMPDENQNQNMILARLMTNGTNVGLTGTWNVLCAFQEAFLFYLFCMGPIAAALWVWPVKSLRGALGSWCEGVMILCFWSLFWNTVVLLMACFRGVSETGTVIMTALNFLSTIVTQYAFDFVGLVTAGASQGVAQALQGAAQSAGGAGGGSGGGSGGKHAGAAGGAGAPHHSAAMKHGPQTANSSSKAPSLAVSANSNSAAKPAVPANSTATTRGLGGSNPNSTASATTTPPNAKGGAVPLKESSADSTSGVPGMAKGAPVTGDPTKGGPPLTTTPTNTSTNGAGGPSLHINGDGSMSVNGNHGEPLSAADKKSLSEQMSKAQTAMEQHDTAALAKMAGPDANMKDINNLAQNGSLSTAAQVAMVNNGAGLSTSADGHLVSSTGVPGVSGVSGSQATIGVVGANGLSGHGVNIGGPGEGPQVMSKDGFQGTAMGIQSGVDYSGASSSQINQLAKENHLDPNQMSMLTGQNGKGEITGPNGQPLANIQDGHMYAPGSNGNVMMEQNGQWAAASTGTPLTHDKPGNNWEVSGAQSGGSPIGFDANSGNFNVAGHSMTASEFAQNTPQGVYAHTPGEHNAPAVPNGEMSGLSQAQQAGMQQLGNADGMHNLQMSASSQQVTGLDANNQSHVIANEVGGQWVSAQQQHGGIAGGEVMNSQGQFGAPGGEHQSPAVSSGSLSGLDAAQQQAVHQTAAADHYSNPSVSANGQQILGTDSSGQQHVMANEINGQWVSAQQAGVAGGEVLNSQGQWVAPGGEHQAQAVPLGSASNIDSVQQQAFTQLGNEQGLHGFQESANHQQILGTDSSGQQHVMATEVNGQWAAAQHNGSADVVMNGQGQWVAPGSSTPLAAHEGAGGTTTWSAQAAPEVSYNPTTHTMESGGYSAPASAVTPDMVSNIHNQHAPENLAIAGNTGLQQFANEAGAGSAVHAHYDSQTGQLQAVGDGNNQVVANYNSAEHRWEAAGSNGQVVENSAGQWVTTNAGVNGLGSDIQVQANHQGGFDAVGQNGNVVASYDTANQRWTADNGSVVQDNNHNWVANNQYVNTAQETPVQYNPGGSSTSYEQSSGTYAQMQSSDQGTWSAQAAPELTLSNGMFSTTYGDGGSAALSMSSNDVTPDLVNYVHQNPQQIEGLQNLANHDQLPGSIQLQSGGGGTQAIADGQVFAQNSGSGWVSDPGQQAQPSQPGDSGMSAMQQLIDNQAAAAAAAAGMAQQASPDVSSASQYAPESSPQYAERNDGSWVTQDTQHTIAHASDGHAMTAQPEPQMPSSPPTSAHSNPSIAAAGFSAGSATLGAWGALKKQNSMNNPPPAPKAPAQQSGPSAPEATAQNTSLTPQQSQARQESERKRREAQKKLLEDSNMPGLEGH